MKQQAGRKSFFHHAMIYWLGRMAARSLQILLLPVYTACLSPEEYGKISIFAVIIDISMLVFGLQLPVTIYKFWVDEGEAGRKKILSNALFLTTIVPTLFFLPVYLGAVYFADLLGLPGDGNLLRLILFEAQVAMVVTVVMTELRVRDVSGFYSLLEISQMVAMGLVSIVMVAGLGWGVWGMFGAQALVFVVLAVCLLPSFIKKVGFAADLRFVRKMLGYSVPLIPAAVAMAALHTSDRIFLQHLAGLEATGLYAIGYKFGMLVSILVAGPFLLIWEPRRFVIAREADAACRYGEIFTYLLVASATVALALTGIAPEIVRLMTAPEYWSTSSLIPLVAWSYVLFAITSVVNVGLFVHGKTGVFSWITLVVVLVNMAGNTFFIPLWGAEGAAISTLISFGLFFLLNWWGARDYISLVFEWKRIGQLFVLIIFFGWILNVIDFDGVLAGIVAKTLIMFLYLSFLLYLGFFESLGLGRRAMDLWDRHRRWFKI